MEKQEERLLNFRCNVELLDNFGRVCKANGTDISKALRGFMYDSVVSGKIVKMKNTGVKKSKDFRDTLKGNLHNIPPAW